LTIQQVFSAGFSLPGRISAPAKLQAPDGDEFLRDFWFLRCRWADAHQSEKAQKRLKDTLSGVYAFVKRCYTDPHNQYNKVLTKTPDFFEGSKTKKPFRRSRKVFQWYNKILLTQYEMILTDHEIFGSRRR